MSVSSIPIRTNQFSFNSLIECMAPALDYPGRVITPSPFLLTSTQTLLFPIPNIDIDKKSLKISIELPTLDSASSATSIASDQFTRSFEDMRKFAHDFTFALFADVTDQKLSTVFPLMADEHDNATPDIVAKILDKIYVIEFSTNRNPQAVLRAFETKRFTYEGPLKSRMSMLRDGDYFCHYGIIIVAHDRVCTNINLPIRLVNELCARYRCALSVLSKVEAEGLSFGEDTLSGLKEAIKTQLSSLDYSISPKFKDRTFTKEILDPSISERKVAHRTAKYYEKCLLNSMKNMDKPMFKSDFSFKTNDKGEKGSLSDSETIENFMQDYCNRNPREDPKSVIKFPLVEMGSCEELPFCTPESHPYSDFWNEVLSTYRVNGESFLDSENLERIKDFALSDYIPEEDDVLKDTRKYYHRIKLDLGVETMLELQKVGVEGKGARNNPQVKMYREEKTQGLSLKTSTTDISEFINDFDCLKPCSSNLVLDSMAGLLRLGLESYGSVPTHGTDALKWIFRTVLFNWCQMVSDIGMELAISLKQHCKHKEFILKKLRNYPVWLMIKPTNSESHVFVSMLFGPDTVDLEPEGRCFKTLYRFSRYSCTEFVSFDESKITNLVKTAPFLITQIAQWSRYFEVDYSKPLIDNSTWSMIKLCLLVHLDDKSATEESMTLMRYVCMERFSSLSKMSNLKMLDKIPKMCRSRLQAWATMKLIDEMCLPPYTLKQEKKEKAEGEHNLPNIWLGMRNPYLDIPISNPQQLIELFYIGYAKNKDEKSNTNQDFQLLNKILKYENKIHETDSGLFGSKDIKMNIGNTKEKPMETDLDDEFCSRDGEFIPMKHHEWSRSPVLHAADVLKKHLSLLLGSSWEHVLEQNILTRLSYITWEDIATLKASSIFDPNENFNKSSSRIHTKREKVILRVIQELEVLGDTPMTSLIYALEYLETKGGLIVDIFKKNQHGGLREIYVLDLCSRLVQRAVEEIAKAYCSYLPSEVMVHPENKIRRPQQHLMTVAKNGSKYKKNVSSSNDASVWNQGHHVLKFTQFMCRIMPNWLKPFYQRTMQLWMSRMIKLPDGIINLLRERPDVRMYDEINQQIVEAYSGLKRVSWMEPSSNYIKIETGMMQGILHYTSSLFHASVLLCRDSLFQRLAKARGFQAFTCDMVSSDDSSRITDVVSNLKKGLAIGELYAKVDHMCIVEFSKLFGIKLSPKSTIASNWVMEFNSEWLFRVNLIRPVLKWSFASLGMTEDESIYERQEVWNVQITELLEGGSGFVQAHLTQLAQGLLHYMMIGSSVNPLFFCHINQIRTLPDPSLGFFLMDHPYATGLFGLSFAHWIIMTSYPEINKRAALFLRSGEMTTTTKGIVTRGCVIRFGERKRAMKLVEECESIYPNWRTDVETDPQVLYMAPRDKRTAALKIMSKLTSPSVMTSLSKNSALTRIIASSVYIISRHAVTLGSSWLRSITSEEAYKYLRKTTLFKEATRELPLGDILTQEEMTLLFPAIAEYQTNLDKLIVCSQSKLVSGGSRKSLRSHVPIYSGSSSLPYSLEEMCKWKWFGDKLPASKRILALCWHRHLLAVPWLRDDPQETLSASAAFESQIQLRNFIARQGPRTRTVHLTGAPVRDSSHNDMIISAITKNQFPGKVLITDVENYSERIARVTDSLSHNLLSTHTFPFTDKVKTVTAYNILKNHPIIWNESMRLMNNRQSRLAILQYYCMMDKSDVQQVSDLFSKINDSRLGIVGGFVKRQDRSSTGDWVGKGVWAGKIGDVTVNIQMEDGEVYRILVSDINQMRESQSLLSKFLAESKMITKNCRNLRDIFYFDGYTINPSNNGCPILESEDLITLHPTNLNLEFKFSMNSFRLIARDRPISKGAPYGPPITLLSYLPKSWDYQPGKNIMMTKQSLLYSSWLNNKALSSGIAHKILVDNMNDSRHPIDNASFHEFAKVGLFSSLLARGWNFDIGEELFMQLTAQDLEQEQNLMMGDYDDFMFDDETFEEIEGDTVRDEAPSEDSNSDVGLAFDWQDVELGLMEIVNFPIAETDIRRGHKIWSSLVNNWNAEFSTKDRNLLSRKKYTAATAEVADIFTMYFGWNMTLYSPSLNLDLEPIGEEVDIYGSEQDLPEADSVNIEGDEWWEI